MHFKGILGRSSQIAVFSVYIRSQNTTPMPAETNKWNQTNNALCILRLSMISNISTEPDVTPPKKEHFERGYKGLSKSLLAWEIPSVPCPRVAASIPHIFVVAVPQQIRTSCQQQLLGSKQIKITVYKRTTWPWSWGWSDWLSSAPLDWENPFIHLYIYK